MVSPGDVLPIELPAELRHVVTGRLEIGRVTDLRMEAAASLSPSELAEFSNLCHPERRAEWLAARICLKQLVCGRCGVVDPRELSIVKDERGRPRLCSTSSGIPIAIEGNCSLTHARPWVAAAWTDRADERVGIDIERVSPRLQRASGAFVSPRDRAAVRREELRQLAVWWCLKEACAKSCGLGLGAGLAELVCVETSVGRHDVTRDRGATFLGWHEEFEGFVVALCVSSKVG